VLADEPDFIVGEALHLVYLNGSSA